MRQLRATLTVLVTVWAAAPASAAPTWAPSPPLPVSRATPGVVLLPDGRVWVCGGVLADGGFSPGSETYDVVTNRWSASVTLDAGRAWPALRVLRNGRVLIIAGSVGPGVFDGTARADLFDVQSGRLAPAANLNQQRADFVASRLSDGRVLVVQGGASGEVYDPAQNQWTPTSAVPATNQYVGALAALDDGGAVLFGGDSTITLRFEGATNSWIPAAPMPGPRTNHSATRLPDGGVLVLGGDAPTTSATAWLYRPQSNSWLTLPSMSVARSDHVVALLPSGNVLVAGGYGVMTRLDSAERFEPAVGAWFSEPNLRVQNSFPLLVNLPNGRVLELADPETGGAATSQYSPWREAARPLPAPPAPLSGSSAVALGDGRVVFAGGFAPTGPIAAVTAFDPATDAWAALPAPSSPRALATATLLRDGRVLLSGGVSSAGAATASVELYEPVAARWRAGPAMSGARVHHTATLLSDGRVLVAGGQGAAGEALADTLLFDPVAESWSPGPALQVARARHAAVTLRDDRVVVIGGLGLDAGTLSSVELFSASAWSPGPSLTVPRSDGAAVLLSDDTLMVFGGTGAAGGLRGTERLGPGALSWTAGPMLSAAVSQPVAHVLRSGRVLISGNGAGELYDPLTDTLFSAPALTAAGAGHRVAPLPDGRLLVASDAGALAFDEDDGRRPAWAPTLVLPRTATPGSTLDFTGTGFEGVSEMSNGTSQASPSNHPVLALRRFDNSQLQFATVTRFDPTSATAVLPSALKPGWYRVSVVVGGVSSAARALLVGERLGTTCATSAACSGDVCAAGRCCSAPCAACVDGLCDAPLFGGTGGGSGGGAGGGAGGGSGGGGGEGDGGLSLNLVVQPSTVVAGEATALLYVELRQGGTPVGAPSDVEVTLETSSARAGFLLKLDEAISRTKTLVIPPGASRGAFYYRDYAAGVATLSATATGYATAHATIEVTPAATGCGCAASGWLLPLGLALALLLRRRQA